MKRAKQWIGAFLICLVLALLPTTAEAAVSSTLTGMMNANGKPYLTWTAVDGATGYEVWHANGEGGTFSKLYSTASGLKLTHTSAALGSLHRYQILATADGALLAISNAVQVFVPWSADSGDEDIVRGAYNLPDGFAAQTESTLSGVITRIDTPWSDDYQNITVTIQIGDLQDMPIMCYRLRGSVASELQVGDQIKVCGYLKNYRGTIEFDAGCQLLSLNGEEVPPPAPVLTGKFNAAGKPYLTWTAVDGAAKYEVFYSTDDNTFTKLTTTTGNALTHSSAKSGTTYYYKVRAIVDTVPGLFSGVKTITTYSLTAPTLTASKSSAGKPYLSWTAVDGAAKYELWYSTDGIFFTHLITTAGKSVTHTSAKSGTTYYYKVRAINGTSTGMFSSAKSVSVTANLAAPTLTASKNSAGKPYLSWAAVTGAAKYEVYFSTDGVNFTKLITTGGKVLTHTSAKSGTTYYYKVRAINGTITGEFSAVKNIKVISSLAAPALTASKNSAGKPYLRWAAVSGAAKYELWCSTDGTNFTKLISTDKKAVTHTSAKAGTTYHYKVRAINGTATGAYSAVKSFALAPELTAPTLTVTGLASGRPSLRWNAVAGATKYEVQYSTDGVNFKRLITTTKQAVNHTSAANGGLYWYKVRALNETTAGAYSNTEFFAVLDPSDTSFLAGTYDVTMWVSEIDGVAELTQQQIDAFEAANPGVVINASIEGVTEAGAGSKVICDVASAPDIYCFDQFQMVRLVQAAALAAPGKAAAETIKASNDAGAVAAASVGGSLYAYPMTSDNGYYLYYDKSIISERDADSLEAIIAACEANGVKFRYALENAWYTASFFFATGCHSNWHMDTDGNFTAIDDDFNSEAGLTAMKGMTKLVQSFCYDSNADIFTDAGAIVTGIWNANAAAEHFGDNMGVTDLPSFEVDGKSYHLGSFGGNKLMGVKPQNDAKKAAVLSLLAQYLTNEECQKQRYEEFEWGPSNKNVQASDAVQANIHLAALLKQSKYAQPQGQIHGSWWDIAKVLGADAKAATSEAYLRAALDNYKTTIDGLFSMTEEMRNAWSVIGGICGTCWDTDFAMYQTSDNTWVSDVLELKAGEEFKVRQGASWDVNFGVEFNGANVVVEADGKYKVRLVWYGGTDGTVTLIPVD